MNTAVDHLNELGELDVLAEDMIAEGHARHSRQ